MYGLMNVGPAVESEVVDSSKNCDRGETGVRLTGWLWGKPQAWTLAVLSPS